MFSVHSFNKCYILFGIKRFLTVLASVILILFLAGGCAHYPVNPPLNQYSPEKGYRAKNMGVPGNSDKLLLVLTFSGGGLGLYATVDDVPTELGALMDHFMEKYDFSPPLTDLVYPDLYEVLIDNVQFGVKDDIYAFFFNQKGLMAGLGLQGSKISRINPDK